jgi:uncharacterized protein YbbC (DUF1343 family)
MPTSNRPTTIRLGLEQCVESPPSVLRDARLGLLMNQASVDLNLRYACDVLAERLPGQLISLFSPQHGLWCEEQANMITSPHSHYAPLGIPVYSLYDATRYPTPQMLRDIDCLVIDLQDVGTRVYTFAWTVSYCLEACAASRIPVVILDRPNPLGGTVVEGPVLKPEFASFVGRAPVPMRHGLTLGELAQVINRDLRINAELLVVPMAGWRRTMLWPDCQRLWLPTSPNMPRFESALLYPGQVLLEGTNLSEGRGTTTPFELIGAPFLQARALAGSLPHRVTSGVTVMPVRYRPTFDKWCGMSCEGLALRIQEPAEVRSFALTVAILAEIARRHAAEFAWLPPPYEYESVKMPIDILFGSDLLRTRITENSDPVAECAVDAATWWQRVADMLLYEEE